MDETVDDPLLIRSEAYGYCSLHNTAFGQRVQRGTMVPPDEVTLGGRMLWRQSTLDRYLRTHTEGQKYVWPEGLRA